MTQCGKTTKIANKRFFKQKVCVTSELLLNGAKSNDACSDPPQTQLSRSKSCVAAHGCHTDGLEIADCRKCIQSVLLTYSSMHWDTLPTHRNNISQINPCKPLPKVTHVVPNGDVFVLNRNISLDSCITSHQSKLMRQQLFSL